MRSSFHNDQAMGWTDPYYVKGKMQLMVKLWTYGKGMDLPQNAMAFKHTRLTDEGQDIKVYLAIMVIKTFLLYQKLLSFYPYHLIQLLYAARQRR